MLKLIIAGNVVKDSEVITTKSEKKLIKFTIAHNESYLDKEGQKKENTTYVVCNIWGSDSQKIIDSIKKGKRLIVEGKPSVSAYINKENTPVGNQEINVKEFHFL